MATIYIRSDEVYRTRVEDITDQSQFFYPIYEQARDCLQTMVNYTESYRKEQSGHLLPAKASFNPIRLRGYPNNIIAFCADRGQGKTSAMLSFSNSLEALANVGKQPEAVFKDPKFWPQNMLNLRFFALESIDPTVLENKDSIIPVIISRMFTHFTDHARQLRKSSDTRTHSFEQRNAPYSQQNLRDLQQQLLQKFQSCYRLADDHKDDKKRSDSYDDLQLLADRGDSSNLKEHFADLVTQYLRFMTLDSSGYAIADYRKTFLIIQVDDADMNPEHAYDVVEDIRKYCVLPNVIVLFAANMDQLELCVEQHFLKSFDPLLKATVKDDTESAHTAVHSRKQCRRTTASYLDKLIPSRHRINLPNINTVLQNGSSRLSLYHESMFEKKKGQPETEQDKKNQPVEYQTAILNILRRKCLLDIPKEQQNDLQPFIPKRMREVTHFLDRLLVLDDVVQTTNPEHINSPRRELLKWALNAPGCKDCSAIAHTLRLNLETLTDYVVHDWSELNLKSWQMDTIKDIHHASADQKIAVALESMNQSYFRYQAHTSSTGSRTVTSNWDGLVEYINHFRAKQDHQFSCALEVYFKLQKDLTLVCDCIDKREEVTCNVQH